MEGSKHNIDIQCSIQWNAGYSMRMYILLQIIYIKKMVVLIYLDFIVALTRVINKYVNDQNLGKKNKVIYQMMI